MDMVSNVAITQYIFVHRLQYLLSLHELVIRMNT